MRKVLLYCIVLTLSLSFTYCFGQKLVSISGRVLNGEGKPLSFASVTVNDAHFTITDEKGHYRLAVYPTQDQLEIKVQFVGKKTTVQRVKVLSDTVLNFTLLDNDLYLDNVTVVAKKGESSVSNSAYTIDRISIEQSNAYSLADLLQMLPGQRITNPQLHGAQSINFRSAFGDKPTDTQYGMNNAFGVGIYLNGSPLSNNANMQSVNPLTDGFFRSFKSTSVERTSYSSGDAPGSGFDLRSIPVGNIERVEIVQGVPSAKYGDITSGAIIIETIAGKSPLYVSFKQAGGNTNAGVNKGFSINEKNALSINIDYLYSNANPTNRIKSYNRLSGGLLWTAYLNDNKNTKNNLDISYSTTLDDFKNDPDFEHLKRTYYKNSTIRVSNKLDAYAPTPIFDSFSALLSLSLGNSTSFDEEFVNPGVMAVTNNTNEGIAEGTFSPASYIATREIDGEPITFNAGLNFVKAIVAEKVNHKLLYGASVSFSTNLGEGRLFDPLRPPMGDASERTLSYRDLNPDLLQLSFYAEDRAKAQLWGEPLKVSAGLRANLQNGYVALSPRLNFRYGLLPKLSLTGAYGLLYKSPGLIHLYPGISYNDYTLLNSYNGKVNESLYLAYTQVLQADNEDLKSMRSAKSELGLNYQGKGFNATLTFFQNVNTNGFSIQSLPGILRLPVYEITERPEGQTPVYETPGGVRNIIYQKKSIGNNLYSRNRGLELMLSVPKIDAIQTAFNLGLAYYHSYYFKDYLNFDTGREPSPIDTIWYGIHPPSKSQNGRISALLTLNHHLPKLGLLVNLRVESFLLDYRKTLGNSNRAIAYLNDKLEIVEIPESERNDPKYDIIDSDSNKSSYVRNPDFVYFNLHLSLSKNLGKNSRLSFFANNFLNIRPERVDSEGEERGLLNQTPYFGMELFFKF